MSAGFPQQDPVDRGNWQAEVTDQAPFVELGATAGGPFVTSVGSQVPFNLLIKELGRHIAPGDQFSLANFTNSIIRIPWLGLWQFGYQFAWLGNATGVRQAWLEFTNAVGAGTGQLFGIDSKQPPPAASLTYHSVERTIYVDNPAFLGVKLIVIQTSGVNLGQSILASQCTPRIWARYLG